MALGIVKSGKGVLKAASGPRAHLHSKLCSGLSEGREQVLALHASSVCGGKARSWDRVVRGKLRANRSCTEASSPQAGKPPRRHPGSTEGNDTETPPGS